MQTQPHLHAVLPTQVAHTHSATSLTYAQTHTVSHTLPVYTTVFPTARVSAHPFAHWETNTYYTHTLNLAPHSKAERIVPGLGDIKIPGLSNQIVFYPLPHLRKISGTNR